MEIIADCFTASLKYWLALLHRVEGTRRGGTFPRSFCVIMKANELYGKGVKKTEQMDCDSLNRVKVKSFKNEDGSKVLFKCAFR